MDATASREHSNLVVASHYREQELNTELFGMLYLNTSFRTLSTSYTVQLSFLWRQKRSLHRSPFLILCELLIGALTEMHAAV